MKFEQLRSAEKIFLNEDIQRSLFGLMHESNIKESEGNNWEKIIIANELSLLGVDVKKELSEEEINNFKEELKSLRLRLSSTTEDLDYIDLARCIYRFQNIGIDFEELNEKELNKIKNLPHIFRSNENLHGHLNYLPQIANSLNKSVKEISKEEDFSYARKYFEKKIFDNKNHAKELEVMAFAGLLLDLSEKECLNLVQGGYFDKNKWNEVVSMINSLQNSKSKEDLYKLSRLLPPFYKMDKLIKTSIQS